MKLNIKPSAIVVILTVVSILGSLFSGAHPMITTAFVLIGLFAYLYSVLLANNKAKHEEYIQQSQAILFSRTGAGNLHFQAFLEEVKKTRKCKNDVELLEKALEIEPDNIHAYAALCCAYALKLAFCFNVGDQQGDDFEYNVSVTKNMCLDALKSHPDFSELHVALGIVYDTVGEHEKARNEFRIAGKNYGNGGHHLLMSTSWRVSGEYQKAIDEVNKAIEKGVTEEFAGLYYGQIYCDMGNYKDAESYLLSAIKIREMRPEILSQLAEIYYMQGKLFRAIKYNFLEFLVLFFVYRRRRGFILLGAAFHNIGIAISCKLSKMLWPFLRKHPKILRCLRFLPSPEQPEFSIADVLVRKGNTTGARELLKKLHKLKPKNAIYYSNLAVCLADEGDISNAISACNKAIELKPNEKIFLDNLKKLKSGEEDLVFMIRRT